MRDSAEFERFYTATAARTVVQVYAMVGDLAEAEDAVQEAYARAGCTTVDPTMPGRVDARTMTGPGLPVEESHSPTRVTEQLFLYSTEQAAQLAIATLSRGVLTCHWIVPGMDQQLSGTHIVGSYPNGYEERVEGIQVKNAVFLIRSKTTGSRMSSVGSAETSLMADRLSNDLHLCRPPAEVSASGSPAASGSSGATPPVPAASASSNLPNPSDAPNPGGTPNPSGIPGASGFSHPNGSANPSATP